MKRMVLVVSGIIMCAILLVTLSGCGSQKYYCDEYYEDSYANSIPPNSHESSDDMEYLASDLPYLRRTEEIPIWKVAQIDIEMEYDEDNDHVDITSLYVHSPKGGRFNLNTDTVYEVATEWWHTPNGIYVNRVIFFGKHQFSDDGAFYIFHVQKIIPNKR